MGISFSHNTASIIETLEYGELKYSEKRNASKRHLMQKYLLDRRKRSSKDSIFNSEFTENFESDLGEASEGRQFGIAGVDYDTIYLSIG